MAKPSKAMIWSLGHSLSHADLSTKGKVNWPILLSECDEQGRFLADAKDYKRSICPIIDEIEMNDVPDLLTELEAQRMVILYTADSRALGQIVKWWEWQKPTWARRSRYPPPPGWKDRIREKGPDGITDEAEWKHPGGLNVPIEQYSLEQNSIEQNRDGMVIPSVLDKHTIKKTQRKKSNTPHHRVVAGYVERISKGYSKRYPGKFKGDLAKIKAMLGRGHSEKEILACYDSFKAEAFWAAKHLSMKHIDENIDDWKKARHATHKRSDGITDEEWEKVYGHLDKE